MCCDQYLATTGPPPPQRRLRPTLKTLLVFPDAIDERQARIFNECDVAGAEVVIVVLRKAREPIGEAYSPPMPTVQPLRVVDAVPITTRLE